jgi:phosphonopyruvate decarboxylase
MSPAAGEAAAVSPKIGPQEFFSALREESIGPFVGVPCSLIGSLIAYAAEHPQEVEILNPVHESHAMAIAAGAYLGAEGRRLPMVFLQSSGLGNIVNPLTSLHQIYEIPALLLVTWRSEGGYGTDAPEHWIVGRDMELYLQTFRLPYRILTVAGWRSELREMKETALRDQIPTVLCVGKGLFASYKPASRESSSELTSFEAIRLLKETLGDAVYLSTTGMISRESFAVRDSPDFYMMGSMGLIGGVAAACAEHTNRRVVALDGDGALLMHLGLLPYIASRRPANFLHVVLDNESYASTGAQPTVSPWIDFPAVALACGYAHAFSASTLQEVAAAVAQAAKLPGPSLLAIKVRSASDHEIGRVSDLYTCPEVARRFSAGLQWPNPSR